jgi:hypothetical protein
MKAPKPNSSRTQRAIKKRDKLRRNWCRRCRFCAPSGRCLDTTLRSGRCGDWLFYVLPGNKLCCRRWVRPKDPRIPAQLHNRVRFGAASHKYSAALTEQERKACIAAGARRKSRPRLGQSGPLTGQQYSVHKEYAMRAAGKVESTEYPAKVPQPQNVTKPSWEMRRGITGMAPVLRHRDTRSLSMRRALLMRRMGVRPMPVHRPAAQPYAALARAPSARFGGGN